MFVPSLERHRNSRDYGREQIITEAIFSCFACSVRKSSCIRIDHNVHRISAAFPLRGEGTITCYIAQFSRALCSPVEHTFAHLHRTLYDGSIVTSIVR